jgi:hypothetical protein
MTSSAPRDTIVARRTGSLETLVTRKSRLLSGLVRQRNLSGQLEHDSAVGKPRQPKCDISDIDASRT